MNFIINWIENSHEIWLYIAVFISAFAENIFTPIPGDTVTVFAAYLVGSGKISPIEVFIASTSGGIAGFMALYYFGRYLQRRGEQNGKLASVQMDKIRKVELSFQRWGYLTVLFNRFLYGIRFAVAIFAGMSKLDLRKTFSYALIGTAAWNILLIYLGIQLGERWGIFKVILWKYYSILVLISAILILLYFIRKIYRKLFPRKIVSPKTAPPEVVQSKEIITEIQTSNE
jgi:membrane protein DedA with SNARE-associated domain